MTSLGREGGQLNMPHAGQEFGGKWKSTHKVNSQNMVNMQRSIEAMRIIGDIQLHEKQIQAQLKGALLWNIKGDVKCTLSRQRQHQ